MENVSLSVGDEATFRLGFFSARKVPCVVDALIDDTFVTVSFKDGAQRTVERKLVELAKAKSA